MKSKFLQRSLSAFLVAAMVATTTVPAMASGSKTADNQATQNDLDNADIIDYDAVGSLTIHKYDITAKSENGTIKSSETTAGKYQYSSTTTASSGDILDYILVSKIPHISSTATFLTEYTFKDVLSEGITYNNDVRIAFYTSAADAYTNNTEAAVDIWDASDITYSIFGVEETGNTSALAKESYDYVKAGTNYGETQLTISLTEAGLAAINGDNTLDENGEVDPTKGYHRPRAYFLRPFPCHSTFFSHTFRQFPFLFFLLRSARFPERPCPVASRPILPIPVREKGERSAFSGSVCVGMCRMERNRERRHAGSTDSAKFVKNFINRVVLK